jgi:HEAT repeat protein
VFSRPTGSILRLVSSAIVLVVLLGVLSFWMVDSGGLIGDLAVTPLPLAARNATSSLRDLPVIPEPGRAQPLVSENPLSEDPLERAAQLLSYSAEEDERLAAAEALAQWVPGAAVPALLAAATGDECPAVREQALRSLDGATGEAVVAAYAAALRHEDLWVQDAGESGLYRLDERAASIAALGVLCADPQRDVRLRAADLLDEMNAGPLAWDELYDGPVHLAWAMATDPAHTHEDTPGEER